MTTRGFGGVGTEGAIDLSSGKCRFTGEFLPAKDAEELDHFLGRRGFGSRGESFRGGDGIGGSTGRTWCFGASQIGRAVNVVAAIVAEKLKGGLLRRIVAHREFGVGTGGLEGGRNRCGKKI